MNNTININGKDVPVQVTQGQTVLNIVGIIYDRNAETPFIAIEVE